MREAIKEDEGGNKRGTQLLGAPLHANGQVIRWHPPCNQPPIGCHQHAIRCNQHARVSPAAGLMRQAIRLQSDAISTHACPQPQVDAGGLDFVREVSQRLVKLLLRAIRRHQASSQTLSAVVRDRPRSSAADDVSHQWLPSKALHVPCPAPSSLD